MEEKRDLAVLWTCFEVRDLECIGVGVAQGFEVVAMFQSSRQLGSHFPSFLPQLSP